MELGHVGAVDGHAEDLQSMDDGGFRTVVVLYEDSDAVYPLPFRGRQVLLHGLLDGVGGNQRQSLRRGRV